MNRKRIFIFSGIFFLTGICLLVFDRNTSRIENYALKRQAQGTGEESCTLTYKTEDGESGSLELQIPEVPYTASRIESLFDEVLLQLDTEILGENQSLTHVDHALNLITEFPDTPVSLSWFTSDWDLMDDEGNLGANIPEEGADLELYAELYLQEESTQYRRTIRVYPQKDADLNTRLGTAIEHLNQEPTGDLYYLPDQIDGVNLTWQVRTSSRGITFLFLSILLPGIFFFYETQQKQKEKVRRQEQLLEDYPEIISKLLLLLGAGLSIRSCFSRITKDYEQQRANGFKDARPAYEELAITCRELDNGTAEVSAYRELGMRCDCPPYRMLATLLSQNLKKGGATIRELLEREVQEAFEERKRQARIRGEKAGTQLLFPMVLLLLIVLLILMVPAYLTL